MQLVTRDEIKRLDKLAVDAGLSVTMMMEHAGLHVARFLEGQMKKEGRKRILVLSGMGHNGGDGLAAARHLANWGYKTEVIFAEPIKRLRPASKRQHYILRHIDGVVMRGEGNLRGFSGRGYAICDALAGYSLVGDPRAQYARLINAANNSSAPTYSIDLPSGLEATTGAPGIPTMESEATITLAAVKKGLKARGAKKYVGKLYLADLGIPEFVYKRAGIEYPGKEFKKKSVIRI